MRGFLGKSLLAGEQPAKVVWSPFFPLFPAARLGTQFFEECLGVHQVGSGKTFGEPAIALAESAVCLGASALFLPEPAEAHRDAEFPRFAALKASRVQCLNEAGLRLGRAVGRAQPEQFAFQSMQFGVLEPI